MRTIYSLAEQMAEQFRSATEADLDAALRDGTNPRTEYAQMVRELWAQQVGREIREQGLGAGRWGGCCLEFVSAN